MAVTAKVDILASFANESPSLRRDQKLTAVTKDICMVGLDHPKHLVLKRQFCLFFICNQYKRPPKYPKDFWKRFAIVI
jgi:hypothetical protein